MRISVDSNDIGYRNLGKFKVMTLLLNGEYVDISKCWMADDELGEIGVYVLDEHNTHELDDNGELKRSVYKGHVFMHCVTK